MTQSKKINYIGVISLKGFHFLMSVWSQKNKNNLNFVTFINRKCLKTTSSVKSKKKLPNLFKERIFETIFLNLFLKIYIIIGYYHGTTHINLIHKVWVNLINERQQKTHGLVGKKSEFHEINLLRGQWVHPENYSYLNPTQLLDLCFSVVQLIPLFKFHQHSLTF